VTRERLNFELLLPYLRKDPNYDHQVRDEELKNKTTATSTTIPSFS
jgi:hypothetical protein